MRQFEVDKGFFGAAGSPLVEGGKVIANVGGKKAGIVAFDAKTGKVVWTATTDAASYSSGVAATILGRRYAVFLTRAGLVGLDPANGQVRFQRPWRARQAASVNAATPIVVGNSIFVSAEYGPGAGVLRFDGAKFADCGCRTRCCRTTTPQACFMKALSMVSTAVRSSGRCFAPSTCRAAKCYGAQNGSAPAA